MILMTKEQQQELVDAIWTLVNGAFDYEDSDEGPDKSLTVVNQSAVDKLHDFATKFGG
jgi:hypothetical protein